MKFSDILNENKEFQQFKNALTNPPVSTAGIVESALSHFIISTYDGGGALVVMYSDDEAKSLYNDLKFFCDKVMYFPSREYVYYNIDALGHFLEQRRIRTLHSIKDSIVVTSLEACLDYTIPPKVLEENTLLIKSQEVYDLEKLSQKLVEMGYTRGDIVEGCGQFSVRGGIIDIFSPSEDFPYRIEFFDDEVDSVRMFDYVSQRTMNSLDEAVILPCREAILIKEKRIEIAEKLKQKIKE